MDSKTWGTPQTLKDYVVVGGNDEIPSGQKAYVFNRDDKDHSVIGIPTWEDFLAGDMSFVKDQIESNIPNTKVLWLKVSWTKAERKHMYPEYWVYGFEAHAIVENTGGAALTGFEIAAIIIGIAFLVGVVSLCLTGGWLVWRIIESIPEPFIPIVGIILLILVGIALLALFGVGFGFSKKGVSIGK